MRYYNCAGLQIRVQHWGDDQHILVTFLILGGMILRFFLMTFFLLARLFFHHFLLKFNYWGVEVKYWGGGGCILHPQGFAARDLQPCNCVNLEKDVHIAYRI